MVFGRQPAFWIGLIVSLVIAVVQTVSGSGLISEAQGGHITDAANAIGQLLVLIAPLITGILIHTQVTPIAAPSLPQGTTVTVITPGDAPNTTQTLG